jgi:hypothetical protein
MHDTDVTRWNRLVEAYAGRRGVTREHAERVLEEMRMNFPVSFAAICDVLAPVTMGV